MAGFTRWLKFNAVGFGGVVLQLSVLAILKSGLGMNYVPATAIAVESAIIHNYLWHERFTWADRSQAGGGWRFLKFNLTTGAFSIGGNLGVMAVLAGRLHLNYLLSNGIAIAVCSVANFLVSDHFVFEKAASKLSPQAPRQVRDSR